MSFAWICLSICNFVAFSGDALSILIISLKIVLYEFSTDAAVSVFYKHFNQFGGTKKKEKKEKKKVQNKYGGIPIPV